MNIPTFAAAMMTRGTLAAKKILDINAQLNEPSEHDITIKGNSSVIIHCLGESCDASKSHIQFGSLPNFVGHHSKKDENIIFTKMKKPVEIMPKPRTALFQGREDDEPMAPQDVADKSNVLSNIAASNYLKSSDVKFGALFLNEKYIANMEKFTVAGLSSPISFTSATVKKEENISSKYIYIGTMRVDINASHI